MPKFDFSKVIATALRHGCSPENLLYIIRASSPKNIIRASSPKNIIRASSPKNTSGRLLLEKAVQELSFHIFRTEASNFSRNELFHS